VGVKREQIGRKKNSIRGRTSRRVSASELQRKQTCQRFRIYKEEEGREVNITGSKDRWLGSGRAGKKHSPKTTKTRERKERGLKIATFIEQRERRGAEIRPPIQGGCELK